MRVRLLAAAVGIVAVSLLLSGALTGLLLGNIQENNAQAQLDTALPSYRTHIENFQCTAGHTFTSVNQGVVVNTLMCPDATGARPGAKNPESITSPSEYVNELRNLPLLPEDRLFLIDANANIVYDSESAAGAGQLPQLNPNLKGGVGEVTFALAGTNYIGAMMSLQPASRLHDPLHATRVVLARSRAAIATQATNALVPKMLVAGGVSLLFALTVALFLSQAMVRPLKELVRAAEDVAAGNYSRRVRALGRNEIGVLGRSFNRMAEAVERARAMQRDFLANVSHELKTPLTSLIGFSQALVDGSLETDEERKRAATILHEEAVRVLRMSQELLDLARVEGGHLSLRQVPLDLGDMLVQEIDIVRARAGRKHLRLRLELSPDLPPVKADPERVHQILENLLDNAVKYAPASGVVIIRAQHTGPEVITTVTNAVGQHPPDTERMFERFYRADPSRSSATAGVGLGLAISRELASAQLGRLWADFDAAGRLCMHLSLQAGSQPAPAALPTRPIWIDGDAEPATTKLDRSAKPL